MSRAFGLGRRTGIELTSEVAGFIPGRAWKRSKGAGWYDGDTLNISIGQGAIVTTPLQLAVMLSAVASRGTVWTPRVIDRIVNDKGEVILKEEPAVRGRIDLPERVWNVVDQGIREVVNTGTGHGIWRADLETGAKTGTAQNPHGEDHAWFSAVTGRKGEGPSLVVVVFIEHGGQGSAAAGPVARRVITAAFPPPVPAARPL
jgi:penicillin-binding protein 2